MSLIFLYPGLVVGVLTREADSDSENPVIILISPWSSLKERLRGISHSLSRDHSS